MMMRSYQDTIIAQRERIIKKMFPFVEWASDNCESGWWFECDMELKWTRIKLHFSSNADAVKYKLSGPDAVSFNMTV
jgi:hypothetical protein